MRRTGPPREGRGLGQPIIASCHSYEIRIGGRRIPWDRVQPLLRRALEVDHPPECRSQEARDLAAYLHVERPTRVQAALAYPLLRQLWQNLNRN